MLLRILVCAALASVAFGDFTANVMMDNVLRQLERQTRRLRLEPAIVNPFAVKVTGNGGDFEANFTSGSLYGLGSLKRQGNCAYGMAGSELRMGCYVSLGTVRFLMNADVKGDLTSGKVHSIATTSTVSANTLLLIELEGRQNFPARLLPMSLPPVTMTTSVSQGKLDLQPSRLNEFIKQTNDNLVRRLARILTGQFQAILTGIAKSFRMP